MDWTTVIAALGGIALFVATASLICRAMCEIKVGDIKIPKRAIGDFDDLVAAIRKYEPGVREFLGRKDVLLRLAHFLDPDVLREVISSAWVAEDAFFAGVEAGIPGLVWVTIKMGISTSALQRALEMPHTPAVDTLLKGALSARAKRKLAKKYPNHRHEPDDPGPSDQGGPPEVLPDPSP